MNENNRKKFARSQFVWALATFLLLNFALRQLDKNATVTPHALTAKSFDYTGVENDARYISSSPNVLLLGSSLFLQPEWSIDRKLKLKEAWARCTIRSISNYHLAQGLEEELERSGFKGAHVYSLAAGGALISDSYLLLSHYLQDHAKPRYVVLDCAPRSFNDTGVTSPNSTVLFHQCFRWSDFVSLAYDYLDSFDARISYLCEKTCFQFQHRQWLTKFFGQQVNLAIGRLSQVTCPPTNDIAARGAGRTELNIPALSVRIPKITNLNMHQSALSKSTASTTVKFAASLEEYKGRYWCAKRDMLRQQTKFLKLLANLCKDNQVSFIVLNMPLHAKNRELLPTGFYATFQSDVAEALSSRAVYENLAQSQTWEDSDFYDSVHLNENGGRKLNSSIAKIITRSQQQLANAEPDDKTFD